MELILHTVCLVLGIFLELSEVPYLRLWPMLQSRSLCLRYYEVISQTSPPSDPHQFVKYMHVN